MEKQNNFNNKKIRSNNQMNIATETISKQTFSKLPFKPEVSKQFSAYAPPNFWGVWYTIESHIGPVDLSISYKAVGDTLVLGKVRYFSENGKKEQEFIDSVQISCGNAVDNVEVCFKGVPTGSAVEGWVG
ncbi:hypothetical protein [Bacillus halotolerans]|uniref:hypothetical protein n=1 Tax=Bacillus halotolerans TaxID=260554 RepID=UPI002410AB20|nr:hypothetical protein [Bacillus halotolerans]MDG3075996.1 hypothetical protein [Bacillus halotolerans]